MPRSTHSRICLLATIACALATASGCRAICSDDACETEPVAEPVAECERSGERRFAGRFAAFQAKCADHFAEEPVVAPHPRFHPVPTRPVFSPVPPEELAVLLAPPKPTDDSPPALPSTPPASTTKPKAAVTPPAAEKALEKKPEVDKTVPVDESPDDPPTRTARPGIRAKPASATPSTKPSSTPVKPSDGEHRGDDETEAGAVHSTFGPPRHNAPLPGDSFTESSLTDEPLLWRAVRTPAGSLRAVPADFETEL